MCRDDIKVQKVLYSINTLLLAIICLADWGNAYTVDKNNINVPQSSALHGKTDDVDKRLYDHNILNIEEEQRVQFC